MAVGPLPPGTLGNLTPDEEQKLQQAWIHLLRLSGVANPDKVTNSSNPLPDITNALQPHLNGTSLEIFRQGFWDSVLSEHPDALVLRFLRARKWDVEKAVAMLASAVVWRVERRIAETIIGVGEGVGLKPDPTADDVGFVAQYRSGKSYVHATDRENRLVYIIRARLHDPRAQSSAAMERFLVSVFEARYPETLGVVLIHNAPFVFWGIWNVVKGWLDPVIASKINFTRKPIDLLHFIPEESLQTYYGGKDAWEYEYVEPIPGENIKRVRERDDRMGIDSRQQLRREGNGGTAR
ncbi:hypothetical protein ONZ43_g4525 [Nemania bipapillata]|uniref:Uncharacterized protein n=1 Tax=Nemania bipapillata TaxID=110536 RepID=A0ACC2ILH0_9PEZI|nr:hypothetical protein ONZ43_g4525 [Nemania bipapillata]